MLNQSSWFIRISSAHVDLIRNLMIHFTSRQIVSDLVQSCHQITLSHFKTYRINCHFYESFHFMTIHSTCVVFLVVTAAHKILLRVRRDIPRRTRNSISRKKKQSERLGTRLGLTACEGLASCRVSKRNLIYLF